MEVQKNFEITWADLSRIVKQRTEEWGEKEKLFDDSVVSKPKPEVAAISDILNDPMRIFRHEFSSRKRAALAAMFGVVLGQDIRLDPEKADVVALSKLTMVVPKGSDNGHSYPVGKPCLVLLDHHRVAMREDGRTGNHLTESRALLRPATSGEIDAFFGAIGIEELDGPTFDWLSNALLDLAT